METVKTTNDLNNNKKDCIASDLPPRAMRYTMESKNNLKNRGSLYVGLGQTRDANIKVKSTITPDDGGESTTEVIDQKYRIPKTGVINPPKGNGTYVLTCVVSSGNNIDVGWVNINDLLNNNASNITSGITDINNV